MRLLAALRSWWGMVHLGAMAMVLAVTPATFGGASRRATARYIYASTWQVLPWFTVLSTLVSLVLIRIVLVTAYSYGLSQFALEMMVRVLVLELIPLAAALFVALRAGLGYRIGASRLTLAQTLSADESNRLLRTELVPAVVGSTFAVLSLAMVSIVIVLLLAYLNVYGMSPWGLTDYTRTVGRVFEPTVTIGFALKSLLFGLAVAVIPIAALREQMDRPASARAEPSGVQPGAIRLLTVLLLIEAASLAVKTI